MLNKLKDIFLYLLSYLYYIVFLAKKKYYEYFKSQVLKIDPQDATVVSVGNITAGGTGKTPFTLFLVENLLKKEKSFISIVLRGYKGRKNHLPHFVLKDGNISSDVDSSGDEAYLYAMKLRKYKNVAVVVAANRPAGIKLVKENGYKYIFLDDAHQRWDVQAHKYLLLWDVSLSSKKVRLLPAGLLREPLKEALSRADYLFFSHCEEVSLRECEQEKNHWKKKFSLPVGKIYFSIESVIPFSIWESSSEKSVTKIAPTDFTLVCGIGNPLSFKKAMEKKGFSIKETYFFPDHYPKLHQSIKKILNKTSYPVIITEKDGVKLLVTQLTSQEKEKIWVAVQRIKVIDDRGQEVTGDNIKSIIL